MKVLNLYAGVGGNRKLWEECEVTAVENNASVAEIYKKLYPQDEVVVGDAHEYLIEHYKEYEFIWTSPPCQTHSRINLLGVLGQNCKARYIDLRLYQEIILLKHFYKGGFVVENVRPYYKALISPSFVIGRHCFWSNKFILTTNFSQEYKVRHGTLNEWQNRHGINIEKFEVKGIDKRQLLRNCVSPEIGAYVFERVGIDREVIDIDEAIWEETL
jgi:DNA (cytosine-5)-methyltransferase 1